MNILSERLEIRLPKETLQLLRREAERRDVPIARLVREAIERMLQTDQQVRMRAAEALFQVEAPVADWEDMKSEIEAAYLNPGSR